MYTREDKGKDTIILTITMPRDAFNTSYNAILKNQSKESDIKGFRKGKVPSDLLEPSMKPMLQFETFEKLAPMYINTAIQKEKIAIIAPPKYSELPKFEGDKDLEFQIELTIMPEFKLGNMKKVKVQTEEVKVEEKDVEQALKELKTNNETEATKIGDDWAVEMAKKLQIENVKDLDSLRKEIEDILKQQKEHMLMHQYQENALKQAINLSSVEIPQAAIEFEAQERERAFEQDMQGRGVKVEDFIKQSGINMEQMREAWMKDAKDALESDVFLTLFAESKDIKVEKEEIDAKIEMIKKSQPNVDESIFTNDEWLEYVSRVERKEKAFKEFIKTTLGEDFLDEHN